MAEFQTEGIFPEMFDVRKQLTGLTESVPNYPVGVKGVILVEPASSRPENERCDTFIFPDEPDPSHALNSFRKQAKLLDRPQVGALVYYFNNRELTHVGKVVENGFVLSKWGTGHVYRHLPHLVPLYYGNTIKYYAS